MLSDDVKQFAKSLGSDIVGIASAERLFNAPGYKPNEMLSHASTVVVMGKRVLKATLGRGKGSSVAYTLTHLNIKLNEVAYEVAEFLEDKGYNALPVCFLTVMLHPRKAEEIPPAFSYKHAAVAAGLGEIGLSRLLITPQFGPRVRLISVITDSPLTVDRLFEGKLCDPEKCGYRCVNACPGKAISRDGKLDWDRCSEEIWKYSQILGYVYCATCMLTCPVGM